MCAGVYSSPVAGQRLDVAAALTDANLGATCE